MKTIFTPPNLKVCKRAEPNVMRFYSEKMRRGLSDRRTHLMTHKHTSTSGQFSNCVLHELVLTFSYFPSCSFCQNLR